MLESLYTIFTTTNPNLYFLRQVLILAIILVVVVISKKLYARIRHEGFAQTEPFVYKYGKSAMDTFYADIYDSLHDTRSRGQRELLKIVEMTDPSVNHSTILDVGCGTGYVVNELTQAGYEVYGVDNSKNMLRHAMQTYPDAEYVYGDVLSPMQFDKSTFTHILCTYFTIYQLEDKAKFFQNCYYWMKPNTYLIIHLVDTSKFTHLIPHEAAHNEEQKIQGKRIITSNALFSDYKYKCSCEIPEDSDNIRVEFKETFVDLDTEHIRQNESHLFMESMDTILKIATQNGFIMHGKIDMKSCNGDENQYLYILERPL